MKPIIIALAALVMLLPSAAQAAGVINTAVSIQGYDSASIMQSIRDHAAYQADSAMRSMDSSTRSLPQRQYYDPASYYRERLGTPAPRNEAISRMGQQNQGLNDTVAGIVRSTQDAIRGMAR